MISKEWVKNELSLSDDCLTTFDRVMLNKVLKDLDRLEKLEKVINFLKLNFNISIDSKLRIDDGSECVQTFLVPLPCTITRKYYNR